MVPFESLNTVMTVSCIVSEIKRYVGRKSRFCSAPCIRRPPLGNPRRNIAIKYGVEILEWCGYAVVKKFDDTFSRFDRIPACDRQTDGRTDRHLSTA